MCSPFSSICHGVIDAVRQVCDVHKVKFSLYQKKRKYLGFHT
ncbi:hypothetical protein PMI08_01663 [Brevibacillus sp. CF112]|nr:hypothetical protein PMI08_01663 [Brevibacillus sp. CF112]